VTSPTSILSQKSVLVIFAYAPAGLGHLRVTDALYNGLPESVSPLLLGSQDTGITVIHRLFSINPILRQIFEWVQYDPQQFYFTQLYYWSLRSDTDLMYKQLLTVVDQRVESIDTVVVVATHFGLAHQIGKIKAKVEKEKKVKIILAVQVTDDSPQFMWYVPDADITFVPSEYTKKELIAYGKRRGFPPMQIEVNAYPVSPLLAKKLNRVEFFEKAHQVDPDAKSQIHLCIPISGAAVGLGYFTDLIDSLYSASHRFVFHVITRSAPYTLPFLNEMIQRPYIKLYVSSRDRDVVNAYEHVYEKYRISLEITKPSEQSFKALLHPGQYGGSLLMFSEPVGRQEYDNISFLRRHGLIPSASQQELIEKKASRNNDLDLESELGKDIHHWRGLTLSTDPKAAAQTIVWSLSKGIFVKMMNWRSRPDLNESDTAELSPYGVQTFWHKLADYIVQHQSPIASS
jgi:hypothetical protein